MGKGIYYTLAKGYSRCELGGLPQGKSPMLRISSDTKLAHNKVVINLVTGIYEKLLETLVFYK